MQYTINPNLIQQYNTRHIQNVEGDYTYTAHRLQRAGIDIEHILQKVILFDVAIPSWATGRGGTRFARFPIAGEPRNIFEKISDCSVVHQMTGATSEVSLHIPWDIPESVSDLKNHTHSLGLSFGSVNSNTFQDQKNLDKSYEYGSLTHQDKQTRQQAIKHNISTIKLGKELGSNSLTIWIGDGTNFPGQQNFAEQFTRYIDSVKQIYKHIPNNWYLLLEHKIFEPAFYSTVLQDWGSSYLAAKEVGEKCLCLVDLGHHAPNVNIEMIVSRLSQFGKLGGFHFNDSKYGDDDLDSGSLNPYQLFLIMAELRQVPHTAGGIPFYMIDQSHNSTDPIESLINSSVEIQRQFTKSLLIDQIALKQYQQNNDALMAQNTLKNAYNFDVDAILQKARYKKNAAIFPIDCYRKSKYRTLCAKQRPSIGGTSTGIV